MIQLKSHFWWDGHLVPAGTVIGLPAAMEDRLLTAGNAVRAGFGPPVEREPEPPEDPDASEDPADAEPTKAPADPDPELKLGRGAPKV